MKSGTSKDLAIFVELTLDYQLMFYEFSLSLSLSLLSSLFFSSY